jgi:hypothetical protein
VSVEHSPGPWLIGDDGTGIYDAEGYCIISCEHLDLFRPTDKSLARDRANAQLVAASLNLVSTLRALVERCDGLALTDQLTGETFHTLASKAIIKAVGI